MAASGRTKVASDVKFGMEHLSSSSTSGPNLVILALMVSKRRCRHDVDDGDDDGDGVRVLSHKRLRQLRWARALKIIRNSRLYGKPCLPILGIKGHLGSIFLQNQVEANHMNMFCITTFLYDTPLSSCSRS